MQKFSAYNFFGGNFFAHFAMDLNLALCFEFMISILNFKKNSLIIAHFANFKPKSDETAQKKKTYFKKNPSVQFLWNSFYRKRLPQQNGDMRKRDLHAFKLHLEQGRLLSPLPRPPPHTR